MSLVQTVSDALKQAMLARDSARVNALRMIRARFIELEKSGSGSVTDEMCIAALRSLKKQREDAIAAYAGVRDDLAASERAELELIESFLPKLADEGQVSAWVAEAIAASGASGPKDFGKVMSTLMKAHKGAFDAGPARDLINRALGA